MRKAAATKKSSAPVRPPPRQPLEILWDSLADCDPGGRIAVSLENAVHLRAIVSLPLPPLARAAGRVPWASNHFALSSRVPAPGVCARRPRQPSQMARNRSRFLQAGCDSDDEIEGRNKTAVHIRAVVPLALLAHRPGRRAGCRLVSQFVLLIKDAGTRRLRPRAALCSSARRAVNLIV